MEPMDPDHQEEGILSSTLGHVLVASNVGSLKSLTRNILLPTHQVDEEGELIHSLLLHPNIIDPDLGVRDTTAVPGLWVWLALDLAIASCWSWSEK